MFECELYIEKRHPPPLLRNSMPKRIHLMGRVAYGVGGKNNILFFRLGVDFCIRSDTLILINNNLITQIKS